VLYDLDRDVETLSEEEVIVATKDAANNSDDNGSWDRRFVRFEQHTWATQVNFGRCS
jgi:hypothetical protein